MPYELYEAMINAYKDNTNFEAAARNWIEAVKTNPFADAEAHEYFFKAKKYYRNWRNGGIDMRSAKRNMIEMVSRIADLNLPNPHSKEELSIQQEQKIEKQKAIEAAKKEEAIEKAKDEEYKEKLKQKAASIEDIRYVMCEMSEAYTKKDEANFKQYAVHMMDIANANPFNEGTEEYNMFAEMKDAYDKHNIRRVIVVAKELCEVISVPNKVILDEPKKVFGVPDEEKKSWFKFLHPWKKSE